MTKEKLTALGWLIYSSLASLCSFIILLSAYFDNIFTNTLILLYFLFNIYVIKITIQTCMYLVAKDFKLPIMTRKHFEFLVIVFLFVLFTNHFMLFFKPLNLIIPFIFLFDMVEFVFISATIIYFIIIYKNKIFYNFFKCFHKNKLVNKMYEFDNLLTDRSNCETKIDELKNEELQNEELQKTIHLK